MDTFISVADARATILAETTRLSAERLLTTDAIGRRLHEAIASPLALPPFDNSAMDGYAVRAADGTGPFRIVGESAAGAGFEGEVGPFEAVRIMTGARLPAGADAVAIREICNVGDGSVTLEHPVAVGENVRRQGEYLAIGETALRAGDRLRPADAGLLASFGRTVVYVTRRSRVTIVATGSELVEPDRPLREGQIVNSNAYMLEALVREAGALPRVLPVVPDDREATVTALRDAAESSDLVLTIGGVSVGDYDYVRPVLDELTGGMRFWKVRMKPGKPLAFGLAAGRVPMLGLPGNPVSSFVGFHQFVAPLLAVQHGSTPENAAPRRGTHLAACDVESTPKREQFVLGTIDEQNAFCPHPDQSSGNVMAMKGCTALAVVAEGVSHVPRGATVTVEYV